MESDLLDKTVRELMHKFGAGNHKPGSGSAAAFHGMVSAKLISTVISLTAEEKRRYIYANHIFELLDIQKQIDSRIYPSLEDLFQFDSEQFDKTIKLRKARDEEEDEIKKNQLRMEALKELKISISIPFQIASNCKELAEYAAKVFDMGFKAARGDSQVGLSGAISAISGCISIIRLNVLSFNSDEYDYTHSVVSKVDQLDVEYQKLNNLNTSKIEILKNEFNQKIPLFEGINKILRKYRSRSYIDVEECTRELQNFIWKNRKLIWRNNIPTNYLQILHPDIILKRVLGYDYFSSSNYGVLTEDNDISEVAGLIDQKNKLVVVSKKYSKEVQRFTASHELGHALMHSQPIMHRDIPADCSQHRKTRNITEIQADKFATNFLMPKKLVIMEFEQIFKTNFLQLDDDTAFKFRGRSVEGMKKEFKNLHEFSRMVVSTELFDNGEHTSLSNLFNVSIEAMAIRLEELNLLKY